MNETVSEKVSGSPSLAHEEISRRAEQLWESYGRPEGRDEAIWLEAEQALKSERAADRDTAQESPRSSAAATEPRKSEMNSSASASAKIPPLRASRNSGRR